MKKTKTKPQITHDLRPIRLLITQRELEALRQLYNVVTKHVVSHYAEYPLLTPWEIKQVREAHKRVKEVGIFETPVGPKKRTLKTAEIKEIISNLDCQH